MSSSSMSFESSQSQSQQFSSVQTSSFAQEQSRQEVYESQEFNGGVMKGYRRKDELSNEFSSEQNNRDSGIFGGINGDCNQLVNEEFDYKKHSVKDLAKHFALVKPKKNIPQNILPEQRMFNGDHAPQLNYLGAGAENGQVVQGQQQSRREVSQQDIEASKAAYEMKKKQQMEAQQQTQTSSSTSSSTVVRRTETSSSEQKTERRMSLRDSLMLDPAKAHADAGLIDPSAILRGEAVTHWKSSEPSPTHLSLRAVSGSPSTQMYISRKDPPSRAFAPIKFSTLPKMASSQPQKSSLPPLPPTLKNPIPDPKMPPQKTMISNHIDSNESMKTILDTPSNLDPINQIQISSNENQLPLIPLQPQSNSINLLDPIPIQSASIPQKSENSDFTATVQSSSNHFKPLDSTSAPLIVLEPSSPVTKPHCRTDPLISFNDNHQQQSQNAQNTPQITNQINTLENHSVIHSMLKTGHSEQGHEELAVSLSIPEVSRSSNPTPAPTTPFPSLDQTILNVPPSPTLRPRTPILVTTRPSSVSFDRTRHVSKDDLAKMMAELNAPLPPMQDIPNEIRASPLIFAGGLMAAGQPSASPLNPSSLISSSSSKTSSLTTTQSSTVSHSFN